MGLLWVCLGLIWGPLECPLGRPLGVIAGSEFNMAVVAVVNGSCIGKKRKYYKKESTIKKKSIIRLIRWAHQMASTLVKKIGEKNIRRFVV